MAGGGVVAAGEIKHYPGRTTFFVIMVCIVAASGGLMFGYDVGISGNSFPYQFTFDTYSRISQFLALN